VRGVLEFLGSMFSDLSGGPKLFQSRMSLSCTSRRTSIHAYVDHINYHFKGTEAEMPQNPPFSKNK
jgi:hypothetical protein